MRAPQAVQILPICIGHIHKVGGADVREGAVSNVVTMGGSSSKRDFVGSLQQTLTGHDDSVLCCTFSPDGKWLATSSADQTIIIWSTKTFKPRHRLQGHHTADVTSVSFSPGSDLLISSGKDCRVVLWDPVNGSALQKAVKHLEGVLHCCFSLDNNSIFATASEDKTAGIWEIKGPKMERKELAGHKDVVFQVCFSSDNVTLASCSNDQRIILWNRRTARRLSKLRDPYSRILTCQFSPDGTLIAAVVEGERVRIWNVIQGEVVNSLEGHHIEPITCCAFSPDGSIITTGSRDKTFALWSVEKHRALPEFHSKAHEAVIQTVAFAPTGKMLATGSSDKTVNIWTAQL